MLGFQSSATDCVAGANSPSLARSISDATRRLTSRLDKVCAGANWALLSYPGPCPETEEPFGAAALGDCVESLGHEVVADLFDVWYPLTLEVTRPTEFECARIIPKRAAKMVARELQVRLGCLLDFEAAGSGSDLDCRAQLVPHGPGTGSPSVDSLVLRAQRAWHGGIPRACSAADFPGLGYGGSCPYSFDPGAEIAGLHACIFETNRTRVPALLDIAFPSDPVCGNGIPQEGEACDDGIGNSDTTPDACRTDCEFPICGDATADPGRGEECDDGNSNLLDGCTPDCVEEICGDEIVNNLPNEDCDDGNENENDTCTSCRDASCGDGVVCSDPSCTSGPDGGPELCDLGDDNSESGLCNLDCFGYSRSCTLTIGVTNTFLMGAVTYELSYKNADGEILGTGSDVECTSIVAGGLVSFFDNEVKRTVRESLIVDAGLQTPVSVATCNYATNDEGLSGADFPITVIAASDTNFNPIELTMAVTNVDCD